MKLYNDWYMMMNKVTGVELYGELKRAALKCDCKMFFHQMQCLHVWFVMHVEGHVDLAAVCEALPRRNKVSKERLTLAPLFGKSLCAKCDAQVNTSAAAKKGKGKRAELAASKARALQKATAAAKKRKGGGMEGGVKTASTFVGRDVEAERVARRMGGGARGGEKIRRGEGSGRGARVGGGGRITHILPDDPLRDHGLR